MDSGKVLREFSGHTSHVLDVKFDVSRIVRFVYAFMLHSE